MTYKVSFDQIQYPTRLAQAPAVSVEADSAENAQDAVVELLEAMGAIPGNITSIKRIDSLPLPTTGIVEVKN